MKGVDIYYCLMLACFGIDLMPFPHKRIVPTSTLGGDRIFLAKHYLQRSHGHR